MIKSLGLIILLTLAGCGGKTVYIYETRTVYNQFDETWLVPCKVVAPPLPEGYIGQTDEMQKYMWASKYYGQLGGVSECNLNLKAAREYNQSLKDRSPEVQIRKEEK